MEEETTIVFFEFVKGGLAFVGFISVSVVFYSTSNVRCVLLQYYLLVFSSSFFSAVHLASQSHCAYFYFLFSQMKR